MTAARSPVTFTGIVRDMTVRTELNSGHRHYEASIHVALHDGANNDLHTAGLELRGPMNDYGQLLWAANRSGARITVTLQVEDDAP